MAIFVIFLATFVGFVTSVSAYITRHVGILGALGLYVAAGWATILAMIMSNIVIRGVLKVDGLVSQDGHKATVMTDRRPSFRKKTDL